MERPTQERRRTAWNGAVLEPALDSCVGDAGDLLPPGDLLARGGLYVCVYVDKFRCFALGVRQTLLFLLSSLMPSTNRSAAGTGRVPRQLGIQTYTADPPCPSPQSVWLLSRRLRTI